MWVYIRQNKAEPREEGKDMVRNEKGQRGRGRPWDNELSTLGLSLRGPVLSPVQCVLHLVQRVGGSLS